MTDPTVKRAIFKIEDDLILVEAATGVLFLAFSNLEEDGKGDCSLAKSLHFTAMSICHACARIRAALGDTHDLDRLTGLVPTDVRSPAPEAETRQ